MNCKTHIEPAGPVYVYDGVLVAGQRSVTLKAMFLVCQTNQLTLKKSKAFKRAFSVYSLTLRIPCALAAI